MSARKLRLLLIAACLVAGNTAAQTYSAVDVATLSPGYSTVVRGPNSAGEGSGGGVLDHAPSTRGGRRGLLFEANGAVQVTEPAGSDNAVVFGVNDTGGFVGSYSAQTAVRGFAGTRAGGATRELPPLGGDSASAAYALNNQGQAAGFSSGAGGQRAVIWDANGTPAALPSSPGMRTRATGINERGDVSGVASTAAGQRPILWRSGQAAAELALLAGHTTGEANAINARGDVVGYSADASGMRHATLWPSGGGAVVDLGTLPGGNFSQAFGSNNMGDVVGASTSPLGSRAVLWTRGGAQDLNSLVAPSATVVLTKAVGITDGGVIIAIGYVPPPGHQATPGSGAHDVDEHDLPVRVFRLVRSGGTP